MDMRLVRERPLTRVKPPTTFLLCIPADKASVQETDDLTSSRIVAARAGLPPDNMPNKILLNTDVNYYSDCNRKFAEGGSSGAVDKKWCDCSFTFAVVGTVALAHQTFDGIGLIDNARVL